MSSVESKNVSSVFSVQIGVFGLFGGCLNFCEFRYLKLQKIAHLSKADNRLN